MLKFLVLDEIASQNDGQKIITEKRTNQYRSLGCLDLQTAKQRPT